MREKGFLVCRSCVTLLYIHTLDEPTDSHLLVVFYFALGNPAYHAETLH